MVISEERERVRVRVSVCRVPSAGKNLFYESRHLSKCIFNKTTLTMSVAHGKKEQQTFVSKVGR